MRFKYKTPSRSGEIEAESSRHAAQQLLGTERAVYRTGNQWHPPEVFYGARTGAVIKLWAIRPSQTPVCGIVNLDAAVDEYEKKLIEDALKLSGWNITEAAKLLMVKRPTLCMKMKRLGIE